MKQKTIEKLCCPFDKHDLQLQIFSKNIDHDIIEGLLTCASCNRKYPIIYGVPILSPDEYRQPALEKPLTDQWKIESTTAKNNLLK